MGYNMKWNSLGDINILIVDDDRFNRQLIISLLDKIATIKTFEANDGFEALDVLENGSIDLVLLDLHMPKKDGYETLKEIKADSKYDSIPIIIVTTDEDEMKKLYDLGADDFISKPFKLAELNTRIFAQLERQMYLKKYNELYAKKVTSKRVINKIVSSEKDRGYNQAEITSFQKKSLSMLMKMLYERYGIDDSLDVVAILAKALSLKIGYDEEQADDIYYATTIRYIGMLSLNHKFPPPIKVRTI